MTLSTIVKRLRCHGTVMLLESQSEDHPWSQRSFVAGQPCAEIKAFGDDIHIIGKGKKRSFSGNPWQALQNFRAEYDDWIFGYLGYDLKNHIEDLTSTNKDDINLPDLYFMVPEVLVEQNPKTMELSTLKGSLPSEEQNRGLIDHCKNLDIIQLRSETTREDYLVKIKQSHQAITDGEFYEVNLSHQLKGEFDGDPWQLYKKMKEVGPVPFGSFIDTGNWSVCCQSPERFLRKEGNIVSTQPIKGTAERGEDKKSDQELKQSLINSVKERAENLMIVDLVRNDLSRTAQKGTVEVTDLFTIETFGTVHQMVSTVKAQAREQDSVTILKHCFPMGSMTGAPKIRAMETIEELEDYKRGLYSGAIGYIKPDGNFDFNVVIRTAIIKENILFYAVGGAITADSDPQSEWEETWIKSQALQKAINPEGR